MKAPWLLAALFTTCSTAAAQEVTFTDTFAVTDTATGDHVLSSRLENRFRSGRDVLCAGRSAA